MIHAAKRLCALPFIALAAPALADPGHLEHVGGHSHWLALGAFAGAAAIALVGIARSASRRRKADTARRTAGPK